VKVDFPYVSDEIDRHGNPRVYVRRGGRRVRIKSPLGTPEFAKEYAAALETLPGRRVPTKATGPRPFAEGTFGWLAARYFTSAEFLSLPPKSRASRRGVIESCLREPFSDTDPDPMGNCPLVHLTAQKIRRLRDLKRNLPGAANTRKKWLSSMFTWATEQTPPLLATNPAREVKRVQYATDGWHTWTTDEVRQYEARHAVGSKARLALALLLYTGVRRSDLVTLGPERAYKTGGSDSSRGRLRTSARACRKSHGSLCSPISLPRARPATLRSLRRHMGSPSPRPALAAGFATAATKPACPIAPRTGFARQARRSPRRMARPCIS
jgi:hypothetical protein